MDTALDFICDTMLHVSEVQENLEVIASELRKRGLAHDRTKFMEPEFSVFVSTRERFKKVNYGTPEYAELVDVARPAVDHHHGNNRHHTGYHENGIVDMSLIDIMEMLADWRAAARRSPDRSFEDTLPDAFKKYGIKGQLKKVIINTLINLNWL